MVNQPLTSKIMNRPLVSKIPNQPLVFKIPNQPLVSNIWNWPLVSSLQSRRNFGEGWGKKEICTKGAVDVTPYEAFERHSDKEKDGELWLWNYQFRFCSGEALKCLSEFDMSRAFEKAWYFRYWFLWKKLWRKTFDHSCRLSTQTYCLWSNGINIFDRINGSLRSLMVVRGFIKILNS